MLFMGEKRPTKKMTRQQLRDFTIQLRKQADILDAALNEVAVEKDDEFAVALFPTLKKGIDALSKFIGAVHTSLANRAMNGAITSNAIEKSQQDAERRASEDKSQETKKPKKKPNA